MNNSTSTKYFSDMNGESTEVFSWEPMSNADFAAKFPQIKGVRFDSFSRAVGRVSFGSPVFPITRTIRYKNRPSLHICNAKCRSGKCGGVCECQCGGKNHGCNC